MVWFFKLEQAHHMKQSVRKGKYSLYNAYTVSISMYIRSKCKVDPIHPLTLSLCYPSFILTSHIFSSLQPFGLSISAPPSILPILQGLKARNFIHSKIEENIKKKVQESVRGSNHRDALQQLIDSSKKNGEPFSMQVMIA